MAIKPRKFININHELVNSQINLFAGDETFGYFLVSFTKNPADEYELRYSYYYKGKLMDLRDALRMDAEKDEIDSEEEFPERIEKALHFFEENAFRVASEKEFWGIMKACEDCVQDLLDEEGKE